MILKKYGKSNIKLVGMEICEIGNYMNYKVMTAPNKDYRILRCDAV